MGRDNSGMHFIRFATDKTALHEFDYDNDYHSNRRKENPVQKQTGLWTMDGEPIDVLQSINVYRSEKSKNARKVKSKNSKKRKKRKTQKRKNQRSCQKADGTGTRLE